MGIRANGKRLEKILWDDPKYRDLWPEVYSYRLTPLVKEQQHLKAISETQDAFNKKIRGGWKKELDELVKWEELDVASFIKILEASEKADEILDSFQCYGIYQQSSLLRFTTKLCQSIFIVSNSSPAH